MPENILNDPQAVLDLYHLQGDRCIGDVPDFWLKEKHGIGLDGATLGPLTKILERGGLSHYHMNEKQAAEFGYPTTSLFAYNKGRLQELLDKNKDMLVKAEWPTRADRFVYYLTHVKAPCNTEIWDFIARCHGDDRNPGLRKNNRTMTDAEIEMEREGAERSKEIFRALRPDFFKDDEAPSVSNNAGNGPSAGKKGANLYDMLAEHRGGENINGDRFYEATHYLHPNAAQKTRDGFKIGLRDGGSIEWKSVQKGGKPRETISGGKDDFTWEHASAIVAMARVNGWHSIDVHGSREHKEMLWLATQRQAMHERNMQLVFLGKDKDPLPQVANFKPAEKSAVYKQWLVEKADWEKDHGGEKFDNSVTHKANPAQTPVKNEAKTPRDKILRAFGEKLRTRFNKYAGKNPAIAPQRDTALPKPAGTKSRFHRKPSS